MISIVFNSNELSTPHDKVASVLPISELEKHVELPLHWAIKNTKIGQEPKKCELALIDDPQEQTKKQILKKPMCFQALHGTKQQYNHNASARGLNRYLLNKINNNN